MVGLGGGAPESPGKARGPGRLIKISRPEAAMHYPMIHNRAVLKAKMKNINFRIRAGIAPKPMISLGKWQSGPSPGTPRAKEKIRNHCKHSQDDTQ